MAQKTKETEIDESRANYLAIWLIGQIASEMAENGEEKLGVYSLALRKADKLLGQLKP